MGHRSRIVSEDRLKINVTHNVVKFLTALRNSVMNVSSECVDNFHYYNHLELLLLILVCIHMSCFVYFGKNVVPIGH